MPSSLGPMEILVILVVALIVLGPAKLPQAGRQVGKALAEIRRWSQEMKNEVTTVFDAETRPTPQATAPVITQPATITQPQAVVQLPEDLAPQADAEPQAEVGDDSLPADAESGPSPGAPSTL